MRKKKEIALIVILLIFVISWSTLLFFLGPQRLVDIIGAENSYLLLFVVAAFGGVSTFTSLSFYTTFITLIIGGLNPFIAAIIAGVGISIGDTFFFFIGKRGNRALSGKSKEISDKIRKWLEYKTKTYIAVFVFLYAAFVPLPNDIMTVSLGLLNQQYKIVIPPLLTGNIINLLLIGLLASSNILWF